MRAGKAKNHAAEKKSPTIRKLVKSVIVFAVGLICYSVTAFAWFQASVQNSGNVIQAAEYLVRVSVCAEGAEPEPCEGKILLKANTKYTVYIEALGDASTGYCRIDDGKTVYNTENISKGQTLAFIVLPAEDTVFTFEGVWGTAPHVDIRYGSVFGDGNAETDTLQENHAEQEPLMPQPVPEPTQSAADGEAEPTSQEQSSSPAASGIPTAQENKEPSSNVAVASSF